MKQKIFVGDLFLTLVAPQVFLNAYSGTLEMWNLVADQAELIMKLLLGIL